MILHSLYASEYLKRILVSAAESQDSTFWEEYIKTKEVFSNHHEVLANLTPQRCSVLQKLRERLRT